MEMTDGHVSTMKYARSPVLGPSLDVNTDVHVIPSMLESNQRTLKKTSPNVTKDIHVIASILESNQRSLKMLSGDVTTEVRAIPSMLESNQRTLKRTSRNVTTEMRIIPSILERNQRTLKMKSREVTTKVRAICQCWSGINVYFKWRHVASPQTCTSYRQYWIVFYVHYNDVTRRHHRRTSYIVNAGE